MKKNRRRNQMVITALALMIAVAGYLNFSGKEMNLLNNTKTAQQNAKTTEANESSEGKEAAAMDEVDPAGELMGADESGGGLAKASTDKKKEEAKSKKFKQKGESQKANQSAKVDTDDSLAASPDDSEISAAEDDDVVDTSSNSIENQVISAQLSKEQNRSKNREILMDLINSDNVSKEKKKEATNQLLKMSDYMEKESAAEQVLSARGYKNSIVSMSDKSVDVLVALSEITDVDRAKIEDIVQRKTGVSINNIVISQLK